jgi:hypothetical protein
LITSEGLASESEMKDIGLMHYFMGMEVWREDGHVFLGQGEVCNEYSEQISNGELQTHINTYGHQLEEA